MRMAGFGVVASLLLVSQAARADLPLSGAALGQLEAVLEYCGRVDPASAERYQQFAKVLTAGAKDEEISKARKSPEYLDAHDSQRKELDKLPTEELAKTCAEGLPKPG